MHGCGQIPQGQSHESAGSSWNLSDMNLTESLWAIDRSKLTEALIQVWYHNEEIGGLAAKLYERIAKVQWRTHRLLTSVICNDVK